MTLRRLYADDFQEEARPGTKRGNEASAFFDKSVASGVGFVLVFWHDAMPVKRICSFLPR